MAKACVRASGKNKGKLKPGWKFGKGGRCIKAGSKSKSSRTSCKYGKLKNPTKRRKCKKAPKRGRRR